MAAAAASGNNSRGGSGGSGSVWERAYATGQLSEAEFAAAAPAFARWWEECGTVSAAPLNTSQQQGSTADSSCIQGGSGEEALQQEQQQQQQQQRHAPSPACWLWVRHRDPLTGEERGYLSAEALVAAADTCAPATAAPAPRPTAAAAGRAAALPEAADCSDGDAMPLGISLTEEDEDEAAAVAPPLQVALGSAGGAPSSTGPVAALLEVHIAHHPSYGVPLLLFRARRLGRWGGGGCGAGAESSKQQQQQQQQQQHQRQQQQEGEVQPYLSFEDLLLLLAEPLARHADGGGTLAAATGDDGRAGAPPGRDGAGGGGGTAAALGWAYVALMPHPVLGQPWAALHPCRTAAWMRLLLLEARLSGPHRTLAASSGVGGGDTGSSAGNSAVGQLPPGLRYLVAWFSAVGRAIGLRCPWPSLAAPDC